MKERCPSKMKGVALQPRRDDRREDEARSVLNIDQWLNRKQKPKEGGRRCKVKEK